MEKFLKIDEYLWPEYSLADLPEEAVQRKYQMLQNEINLPFQVENTSLMSNGAAQAGSISCSSDSAFFPLEKSEVPNTATSEKINMAEMNQTKRIADRTYRIREKERRRKLEDNLKELREENKILRTEKDCLKKERDMVNEDLQSSNAQTKRLKNEICKLKRAINVQEAIVETFSHKVMNDEHKQELTRLGSKIDVSSRSTKWEDWMIEKEELLQGFASLEHQNKMLRVQVEALCLKIIKSAEMVEEDI